MVQIFSRETIKEKNIERRKQRLLAQLPNATGDNAKKIEQWIGALENGTLPNAEMPGFDTRVHMSTREANGVTVAEFTSTGDFSAGFWQRQRWEVEMGREEEPELYPSIYNVTTDPNADQTELVYTMDEDSNVGYVMTNLTEGGEVKFAHLSNGQKTMTQQHWGGGIEYDKDFFVFNKLDWMALVERRVGKVSNATLNHAHFNPILTHTYVARQQTDGTALTSFKADADLEEKYHMTLDAAIVKGRQDDTYRRAGSKVLLCALGNLSTVEKALMGVEQRRFQRQSPSVLSSVRAVVAYDGWTGTRGKKTVDYAGVTAGKAYLVDMSHRELDFISKFKQPLRPTNGPGDLSRFILEQVVWDFYVAIYSAPDKSVDEITWPTESDGVA